VKYINYFETIFVTKELFIMERREYLQGLKQKQNYKTKTKTCLQIEMRICQIIRQEHMARPI